MALRFVTAPARVSRRRAGGLLQPWPGASSRMFCDADGALDEEGPQLGATPRHRRQTAQWRKRPAAVRWSENSRAELPFLDLPPSLASQQVQKEGESRREAQRIAGLAPAAGQEALHELLKSLQVLDGGASVRTAWDAVAQRCIELSRRGQLRGAGVWADFLDAFALAEHSNPAILAEAEQSLLNKGGFSDADCAALVAVVAAMSATSPHPLGVVTLEGAAARLRDVCADATESDVVRIAGFAHAFTRSRVRDEHVLSLVLSVLRKDLPPEELDHGVVADLALFCHVFALHSRDLGWLVSRAADLVSHSDATSLSRVLPLLASAGKAGNDVAGEAFSFAAHRHLPALLAASGLDNVTEEAAPLLLEALSLYPERSSLSMVLRLSSRCLSRAPVLDLTSTLSIASSLAALGIRQERLLEELAEQIVVRHQRQLGSDEARTALSAWTFLRAPHAGLEEALRRSLHEAVPCCSGKLADFAAIEVPGFETVGIEH